MTTATLLQLKERLDELTAMFAAFAAAGAPTTLHLPETHVQLGAGERYAGLLFDADGRPTHHLVLLAGEAEDVDWQAAKAWAAAQGGELPTRQEQALLYANLKAEFQPTWYWSGQEHETDGSYAWGQGFSDGTQYDGPKSYEGRARAVRRFTA